MSDARGTIEALAALLRERGYGIETPQLGAEVLAVKRGRGLGPFFPYIDFVFVHDMDGASDARLLERRHAEAGAWSESQFRLPRALRYKIPNTVSIGVSATGFAPATVEFAITPRKRSLVGGARDSTYLLDVAAGRLVSAGLESTPGKYGAETTTSVNPTNRVYRMMVEIAATMGLDARPA